MRKILIIVILLVAMMGARVIENSGTGTGDMLKSVYDTNEDTYVDTANVALTAVDTSSSADYADSAGVAATAHSLLSGGAGSLFKFADSTEYNLSSDTIVAICDTISFSDTFWVELTSAFTTVYDAGIDNMITARHICDSETLQYATTIPSQSDSLSHTFSAFVKTQTIILEYTIAGTLDVFSTEWWIAISNYGTELSN